MFIVLTMNDLTPEKVTKEVEKTGFPLELWAASILNTRGYHIAHGLHYLDRDENVSREIDLRVLRNVKKEEPTGYSKKLWFRYSLVIECKKLANPWVFLVSPSNAYDPSFKNQLVGGLKEVKNRTSHTNIDLALSEKGILLEHPHYNSINLGRNYFEAFKKDGAEVKIHSAVLTVLKSLVSTYKENFAAGTDSSICYYYGIILVDGFLYSSRLDNDNIVTEQVDRVVLAVNYNSENYGFQSHRILVVRKEKFASVLDELEHVNGRMADLIMPIAFYQYGIK